MSDTGPFHIRRATLGDLAALGRLGAMLMRTHYGFNPRRFMAPGADPETGYAAFLRDQLLDEDAAVFVAERGGVVSGYVLAGLEPRSWKELRDPCGFIHDVAVADSARRAGAGAALVQAAVDWVRSRGAPRVMLWAAEQNGGARRLFARLGFAETMVEMTREL